MDLYHIALFVHLLTLIVAAAVTAVTKLAVGRRARARTVGEVLDWHNVLTSSSKAFPICLAVFVLSGMYMMRNAGLHVSNGWIVAGLVGVALLLTSGIFLGTKGRALKQMLDGMAARGLDQPAPKLVPPPLLAALPLINTGIALAVVFDMVTKPTSIPVALGIIAIGIALPAARALTARPARAPAAARAS